MQCFVHNMLTPQVASQADVVGWFEWTATLLAVYKVPLEPTLLRCQRKQGRTCAYGIYQAKRQAVDARIGEQPSTWRHSKA